MRRLFPILVLVAVVAPGCAARTASVGKSDNASDRPGASPAATTGTTPAAGATPAAGRTPSSAPAVGTSGTTRATPAPSASAPTANTMPLTVTLDRTCARHGDTIAVTAVTLPSSKLAFAAYSLEDNNAMPTFQYIEDELNPTGTYTWRFAVDPTWPKGKGEVTVVASHEQDGAYDKKPFVIAGRC